MKILFVSAVLPYPPKSGGQIRMYNLLARLSKKHEITLVSFIREERERAYARDLGFCKKVVMVMRGRGMRPGYILRALTGSMPLLLATYDNKKMRTTLASLLAGERFDCIHLEPFYVWPSVPKTTLPVVVSEHNVEYEVYEEHARRFWMPPLRPFLFLDAVKLRFWEQKVWKHAAALTAVSSDDAAAMKKYTKDVAVVPNGVDLAAFPYDSSARKDKGPVLLFVGDFRWFPNKDAAKRLLSDIWPHVRRDIPGATLRIIGRHISSSMASRIRRAGAEVRADAPDIAREYLDTDVLVAPHAIAGGTKFKMLEAMASGLPVITTHEGMKGIAAVAGTHYLRADTPGEHVAQIRKIWENRKIREALTRDARQLIEREYSWERIAQKLESVWQTAKK